MKPRLLEVPELFYFQFWSFFVSMSSFIAQESTWSRRGLIELSIQEIYLPTKDFAMFHLKNDWCWSLKAAHGVLALLEGTFSTNTLHLEDRMSNDSRNCSLNIYCVGGVMHSYLYLL